MNTFKRFFCVILSFILLFSLFDLPGGAVTPGTPYNDDISRLYEIKYGHKLDHVLVYMHAMTIKSYPFYNDPLVERIIPSDVAFIFELDDEGTLPVNAAPGDVIYYSVVYLNTRDEENLNAFIEKYKNAEGVALIETDGIGYIPETRYAVSVSVRTVDSYEGELLPIQEYTADTFGEAYIKNVYFTRPGDTPLSNESKQLMDMLEDSAYGEARRLGLPSSVVLELKDVDPAAAATFALELIGFENSELFTEEQKQIFRTYITNVELFSYNALSSENPIQTLLDTYTFKVWTGKNADLTKLGANCKAVCVMENRIWYVYPKNGTKETLFAIADKLNAQPGVTDFRVYNGIGMSKTQEKDLEAANLMECSALLPGDADGDGNVTVADARAALRHAVGLENLTYTRKSAADADGNGEVTPADARTLLRAAIGLEKKEELTFTLHPYSSVIIGPLNSYHDGGARWSATVTEGDEKGLYISERTADLNPPLSVGTGPYTFYAVSAIQRGSYTLHIECRRPWEGKEHPSVEMYDVKIIVK